MPVYGYGNDPFGTWPFGDVDYCRIVLWDELPDQVKEDDRAQGYPYWSFVSSLAPSFQWIRNNIRNMQSLTDPRWIRHDLLSYFASNFGIEIDLAEPEDYQRARASLAARWNIIKGTAESYVVLCRVHGFEVNVIPLWWDGLDYTASPPVIFNEASTVSSVVAGGDTTFTIRVRCYPVEPGELNITLDDGGPAIVITDDGAGGWNAPATGGAIDYGWGYMTLVYPSPTAVFSSSAYQSVVGGCVNSCDKCKTHRIRLDLIAGDIAGHDELTVADAFERLYRKIGVGRAGGVLPVHVELEQIVFDGAAPWSIGYRYDIIGADAVTVDKGLRWEVVP